jgi:hypothetical protein
LANDDTEKRWDWPIEKGASVVRVQIMKASKKIVRPSAKVTDRARVRLGSMSPPFPVSAAPKKVADKGKVRLGSMSPAF